MGETNILITLRKQFLISLSFTIITILIILYGIFVYNDVQMSFLILNIFLAWIPLILSFLFFALYGLKTNKVIKIVLLFVIGIIWFIFYPNAPYLLTDIIHIQANDYVKLENHIFIYNANFLLWYELIQFILTFLIGIISGFFSLTFIHKIFEQKNHKISGWIFVVFVSFAAGFGIYIGRFLRLNSWDILNIFHKLIYDFKPKMFELSALLGITWLVIYIFLYKIVNCKEIKSGK